MRETFCIVPIMKTISDIIGQWPDGLTTFCEDVHVNPYRAKKWAARNSVPGCYWLAIVKSAEERGLEGVTYDVLAEIAAASSDKVPA